MARSRCNPIALLAAMALAVLALFVGAAACRGQAQTEPRGEVGGPVRGRLIHRFDFEERSLGNFEDIPMHWHPIGRPSKEKADSFVKQPLHQMLAKVPGYPDRNVVAFDMAQKTSGQYSFHLGADGGNTGAFLEAGTLAALPGSDYQIEAHVLTGQVTNARARITAYFIDREGQRIDESTVQSPLIDTGGKWRTVALRLRGNFAGAASIGMQLDLLQPQALDDSPLGKDEIVYQDVHANAWFDDIDVWQVPRALVVTQSPINIIRAPGKPQLTMDVRDPSGRAMTAEVAVYDAKGVRVVSDRRSVPGSASAPGSTAVTAGGGTGGTPAIPGVAWSWAPPLTRYGWYVAELALYDEARGLEEPGISAHGADRAPPASGGLPLPHGRGPSDEGAEAQRPGMAGPQGARASVRTRVAFLYVPDEASVSAADGDRFTVDVEGLPDAEVDLAAEMVNALGLRSLALSCWDRGTTLAGLKERQRRLDVVLAKLGARGQSATLSLNPMPDDLVKKADADPRAVLVALATSMEACRPYLAPILLHEGQQVRRWQLGSTQFPTAMDRKDLPALLVAVSREVNDSASQARLVVPWQLGHARRTDVKTDVAYAMDVPAQVTAEALAQYLASWSAPAPAPAPAPGIAPGIASGNTGEGTGGTEVFLHMLPAAGDVTVPAPGDVAAHARRILCGLAYGAAGLSAAHPWLSPTADQPAPQVDPLLGVFAMVAHRLDGRRIVGRVDLGPGLECLVFDGASGGRGMLAAWSRTLGAARAVDIYLGQAVQVVDVFGNRADVPIDSGRHHVILDNTPVFLEGVDAKLALFRASFGVTPGFLESSQAPQTLTVTLKNPSARPISGTMILSQPQGWKMEPRRVAFAIGAGETYEAAVDVNLPVSELAGLKTLVARVDFTADQHFILDLSVPLEVGLKNVKVEGALATERNAQTGQVDAVVTQTIVSAGQDVLNLYAFAYVPGCPRQEQMLPPLTPGASVIRRFRFSGAGEAALRGEDVRIGVRDVSGPMILNKMVAGKP